MDDLLSPQDVAKLAGVSSAAVRVWADLGRLPVIRTVSGIRLFRRDDVDHWLATRHDQQKAVEP